MNIEIDDEVIENFQKQQKEESENVWNEKDFKEAFEEFLGDYHS